MTAVIVLQRLFFYLFFSFFYWRTELPEETAFDCRDFKKSSAAHLKGIRPDVQLLKKRDVILDINADHSVAPLAIGSLFSGYEKLGLSFWPFGGRQAPQQTVDLLLPYIAVMTNLFSN